MRAVTGSGRLIAGRYRLVGPIGRGAMGIVWRGRDELLARDVAVKEVQITAHAAPADAEAIYQRTLREARTAARLSHPSVVTVFDVVEENGSPWIVMELVDARSLDRIISEDGPLPPLQAAELGTSLVSALATAHSAGVLHRDVKPSNVLLTDTGRAVLTDFGIATFSEDPGHTQVGMVVGTPGFTAPERVRGDSATPASDLWSLGATLYAAVEGRGPFDRVGGSSLITAGVASEDAPRAPSAGPLGPVIEALLSRDPQTRPDSATATKLLAEATTAAKTGVRPLRGSQLPAADGAAADKDASASAPAAEAGSSGSAAFLDPPLFAELEMPEMPVPAEVSDHSLGSQGSGELAVPGAASMTTDPGQLGMAAAVLASNGAQPADAAGSAAGSAAGPKTSEPASGPVLWGPVKAAAAASPLAAGQPPGPDRKAGSAAGQPKTAAASTTWRSSGMWRLTVATAGIAAIVVAGFVGWNIYSRTASPRSISSSSPADLKVIGGQSTPSPSSTGGSGHGQKPGGSSSQAGAGGRTTSHGGIPKGSHPSSPGGGPSGAPSGGPSGGPSSSPTSGPTSGPSPTPTPSPSSTPPTGTHPGTSAPVLPAGYRWHRFPAAVMGSVAGFKIGVPDPWTQVISGLTGHLNHPDNGRHIVISLRPFAYPKPMREAQYLQNHAHNLYNGYKLLALTAAGFKSLGGFRAAPAALWKFTWHDKAAGINKTELAVIVSLDTKSGVQPYILSVQAPSAGFAAANSVFELALQSFRPLPLV